MYENYTTLPLFCYSTRDRQPPAQGVAVGTGAIEKKAKVYNSNLKILLSVKIRHHANNT